MRVYAKIVNEQQPTAQELADYSEQMLPIAQIESVEGSSIVIQAGSIETALYAVNFLGIRRVILVIVKVD